MDFTLAGQSSCKLLEVVLFYFYWRSLSYEFDHCGRHDLRALNFVNFWYHMSRQQ